MLKKKLISRGLALLLVVMMCLSPLSGLALANEAESVTVDVIVTQWVGDNWEILYPVDGDTKVTVGGVAPTLWDAVTAVDPGASKDDYGSIDTFFGLESDWFADRMWWHDINEEYVGNINAAINDHDKIFIYYCNMDDWFELMGTGWDGLVALLDPVNTGEPEPATPSVVGSIYQIRDADDLLWFAGQVNSGPKDINAKLTVDIDLKDIGSWTPIGSTLGNSFTGAFDGSGYEISGLSITTGTYQGLFGYIGAGGTVENFTITESSVTGTTDLGMVAGSNAGTVSGVKVSDSVITGTQRVGGIVGDNTITGIVTASANISATVRQSSNSDNGIGGIAGRNNGKISLSYNNANIIRTNGATSYDGYFGGIAGQNNNAATSIDSCYNTGIVPAATDPGAL